MLEIGLRVVRGKDWKWHDQDGGEGHAGTVVDIGRPSSNGNGTSNADKTPDKTVIVQWDHGARSNYRIGYQDAYDLMVFDNAATGAKHNYIICNGCQVHGIFGFRWKCSVCFDYDLCTKCYMADKHELQHAFIRLFTPNSVGVKVTTRENCTKVELKGIFTGAKVIRGPDWEWNNQDGGVGSIGRVIDIRGWDDDSGRSVATVTWPTGSTNVYRLGYKGCVDLCCVEEAIVGTYYKEHLPHLGQHVQIRRNDNLVLNTRQSPNKPPSPVDNNFVVGDKVTVDVDKDTLKSMQAGHGGWNPRMEDVIGKIGTVHRITYKGDVRVQYEGFNNRWTFHPKTLSKIITKEHFAVGDTVKIKSDAKAVKHYQRGHGEWIESMKTALGKMGKVVKVYADGDMRIQIDNHTWTFNPMSVILQPRNDQVTPKNETDLEVEKLLRDAARGEVGIPAVVEFLSKYPSRADARSGPNGGRKTCLQVAAHQGHLELCEILINAGASLSTVDDDGDTPLHYAAFGNQPEIIDKLVSRGAPIDAVNNGQCSALHVAVNKQHLECVRTLLRLNCNVNLQDSYGDTTLHDAIGKESAEIVDALCSSERVDFGIRNKRGFNVLHHAALKGNAYAMQRLVLKARNLVDIKKDDGFAALHLAALNGHRNVAATLLSHQGGRARINLQNNRLQTPLQLATSQGHWNLVELLLQHNADITSKDEDNDTVLHIAINKCRNQSNVAPTTDAKNDAPHIYTVWQELSHQGARTELTLICFLVSQDTSGTMLEQARNRRNKTPIDLLTADLELAPFINIVRSYKGQRQRLSRDPPIYQIETVSPGEINRLNPGNGSSRSEFAQIYQDSQLNKDELKREIEKEKAKNGYSEKNNDKSDREKDKDLERLRYLETRIADLEEANMCSICMEHRRNVAFLCGHGACEQCAAPLKTCHMCRQTISKKINLY